MFKRGGCGFLKMADPKLIYKEFSRLLDRNYAAGRAISNVQWNGGKRPILGKVAGILECTDKMLLSYEKLSERRDGELEERVASIGKDAARHAREHDALLDEDICCAKAFYKSYLEPFVLSTSEEMCHPEKKDEFCAKNVRSLQDAMRYMHEKSIDAVFEGMYDLRSYREGARFANFGNVVVFDVGGAISGSANPEEPVGLKDIVSEPLKAVGEYCKDLKSVNVFAARDFMSAQIHIGVFHKANVDAMIRKADFVEGENNSANNHIRLRYIESGCAGSDCRLGYMSKVLKGLGFRIEAKGRFMNAELKGRYPDSTEKALRKLFRLLRSCENGLEIVMDALVDKKMSEDAKMTRETAAEMVIDLAAGELDNGNDHIYDFLLAESIKKKRTS